ncbi:MAG: penicillin-binding transpeptidase domain-containing protein [Planctomycetota bacterium]
MLCVGTSIIAIGRLLTLQTFQTKKARQELANMRIRKPEQRPTVRGTILDRDGKQLAIDKPTFFLHINYQLTRYMDSRWREGRILRAITEDKTRDEVEREFYEDKWRQPIEDLEESIELAWKLADVSREEVEENVKQINNRIWEQARWLGWIWKYPEKDRKTYLKEREAIPLEEIAGTKLGVMKETYPLVELKTQQDLLYAQKELVHRKQLTIMSEAKRYYPYDTTACHLIGWVAPWRESEAGIFEDDKYMSYLRGEVVGKFGLEKVYEPVLRGRRGEVRYDVEGNLLERKESRHGRDVRLTIDIDLQKKVERLLADNTLPHGNKLCAAVVLEVANNDILAMTSIPTFNLNKIRRKYNTVFKNPQKPLIHRALERTYPPGSTVKPLILVAGLEEKKISPYVPISCSGHDMPPEGWPRCLLQRNYRRGHDDYWPGENTGRNAIRGSCNVYFSQLAHRLSGEQLQGWLFDFGFGQKILKTPVIMEGPASIDFEDRGLSQSWGCLEYAIVPAKVSSASELKPLPINEKKWWGMGQGSLRVNVLQVANALSTIVRGGLYKLPRLVYNEKDPYNETGMRKLPISKNTLSVVRDGMKAVVYETHGTAYNEFSKPGERSVLFDRDMTIYGKTGSTQNPEHAWFECFAEDDSGRSIVVAVLVERGLRGAGEAAPLGHRILRLCNEAGYVGKKPIEPPSAADQ